MRKGKDRKKKENKSKFINASPRLHIFGSRVAEEKEKKKKEIKEKYVFWMLSHLNIFCCRLEVVKAKLKKNKLETEKNDLEKQELTDSKIKLINEYRNICKKK